MRPDSEPDLEGFAFSHPGRLTLGTLAICLALAVPTLIGPEDQLGIRLYAWGAKVNEAIASGQTWRLLSAPFLHGGWMHLLFNAYALFVVGSLVERAFGPARFLVIYVAAAIGGSLASYALSDAMSVGASGAIFGLMGAAVLATRRSHRAIGSTVPKGHITGLVLWIMQSLLYGFARTGVDNAAHLGGLATGLGVATILPAGLAARTLAVASAAALAWTGVQVYGSAGEGPRLAAFDRGIEAGERGDLETAAREYTAALPYPPAYLNRATIHMRRGDLAAALADLDSALAADDEVVVREKAHLNRAVVLLQLERPEEALRSATEVASSSDGDRRLQGQGLRIEALVGLGRRGEASLAFDSLSLSDTTISTAAAGLLGDAAVELEQYGDAARLFEQVARASGDPDHWRLASMAHARAGEYRAAKDALDSARAHRDTLPFPPAPPPR